MNNTSYKILTILLIMLALASCDKQEQRTKTVATVGKSLHGKIGEKDFLYSYELTPSPTGNLKGLAAKKAHLEILLNKKLLVLEGLARGLEEDEKVRIPLQWYEEKAVRQQLYREVAKNKVTISEGELRRAFEKSNTAVWARHLPARTLEQALQLRNELLKDATFFDLAQKTFKDSVLANNGGDLGYFSFGDMTEAIEQAAFSLKIGEISEPIKSKWAYHILKVEGKKGNAILTENEFARKKHSLSRIIHRRKESKLADQYIKDFMNPKHVRVYGPSIIFLVEKSKQLMNEGNSSLPQDAPKLRDSEIGIIRDSIGDHLHEVIVEFDGGKWTIGDFLEKLKRVHPDARPTMTSRTNLKDIAARMVRDEFLAQEGYRRGLQDSKYVQEEVRRWKEDLVFNRMRKMLLDTVTVSEKEMNEFLAKNKSKYVAPARVKIREIFVSDEDLAHVLLTRIKAGEDFAKLAKKHSLRKWAAARGGEFGFLGAGMHGEVGKKALSMHGGQRAGPFEIDDPLYGKGFSIFEVIAKKERRYLTFEEVRTRVEQDALMEKQGRILTEVLNQLRKEYEITINEDRLAQIKTTDDIAKGRKVEMLAVPRF